MTKQLHCPKCKKNHTSKKGQCENCDYIFKKSVAEFYNLIPVKEKPIPKKKPISKEEPVLKEELIVEDIYCPGCGKKHVTNDRYCLTCNTDMEPIILEYKAKYLPVKFNNLQKHKNEGSIRRGSAGSYRSRRRYTEADACCIGCDILDIIISIFSGC